MFAADRREFMIANLNGVYETVEYRSDASIQLYDNVEYEEYPRHWHTAIEIIMPVHNSYELDYDGLHYVLREGDIIFLCPGTLHTIYAAEGERYIFQVEMASVTSLRSVEAFMTMLYPGVVITPESFPDVYERIRSLLIDIVGEYQNGAPFYEASIYGKVLEMIVLMRRSQVSSAEPLGVSGSKQREYMAKFMDVCDYICAHCTEDLTLDDMAMRAGFSKYHFSRLFKQFTNVSFYKYLNQKRIENAERLLIDPSASVTGVSLASGFTSLSSFIRMFKLIKGCTPSEYRTMYNL